MRANTKKKHGMGKRFAVVIGVAAAGVMALGAQTGAQTQAPTPPPPTCNGLKATIVGTEGTGVAGAGSDRLIGTDGRDVIVGLSGFDTIEGRAGNDVICGGKGGDSLTGEKGKDTMLGQAGNDGFNGGGPDKDRCLGGKGRDSSDPVCEVEKSIELSGPQ